LLADHLIGSRRAMSKAGRLIERLERARPEEVAAHQERALRRLLVRAATVPRYANLAAQLGKPLGEVTLADLPRIPFLTKEIMREEGERLRIPGARGVRENHSGGSTGVPTRFWQDERYKVHMGAATRRSNQLAGAFPGARVGKLWGAPQDKRQIEGPLGRLKLWLLNQHYYDTFDMGPERMAAYHADLERFQPDLIQAYASSIHLFARYLKSQRIRPTYPRVSIISSAEKLFPQMRAEIEEVFPVRVFDRYGSREVSAMAGECPEHAGLHIEMSGYILETIDPVTGDNVEGRPGEIVITVLNNFAQPFLRYRIGDMGTLDRSPCACGRTSHRLREVVGRTSDNFVMPDGRVIHGEYFTHIFYGRAGVAQFQFVQHTPSEYALAIVPAPGLEDATLRRIEHEVREVIGASARLKIEMREAIPSTVSGKHRFTISHVDMREFTAQKAAQ
jgi:phenylacetate-CoA ligase